MIRQAARISLAAIVAAQLIALPATATITINRTDTRQYISGFGVAANNPVEELKANFDTQQQTEVLDFLFNSTYKNGLSAMNLSIVRLEINPFDSNIVQPAENNFQNYPVQETSKSGPFTYKWDTDFHQRWFADGARQRLTSRFFASVWSPPAWMKRNNSELNSFNPDRSINIDQSRVKADNFDDLALYFEEYLLHYANVNNVHVAWLSLQNEPSNGVPWAAAAYTTGPTGDMSIALETIRNRFNASALWAKLMAPETAEPEQAAAYLDGLSSAARQSYDIIAAHNYGPSRNLALIPAASYGKPLWHTEGFGAGNPANDADADKMFYGVRLAQDIRGVLNANSETYTFWWAVSRFGATPGTLQALVRLVDSPRSYVIPKRSFAMGQFSRYVRPGYYRIGSTSTNANLQQIAFHDPASGRAVIVVINPSATEYTDNVTGLNTASVDISRTSAVADENIKLVADDKAVVGGVVSVRFPAQSVTTIIENVDHSPAPAAVTDLTAQVRPNGTLLPWTATGDNGLIGTAYTYDIRRSTVPITAANFGSAAIVRGAPPAFRAGERQTLLVTGSNAGSGAQYYALRVIDERLNYSPVSNVVIANVP